MWPLTGGSEVELLSDPIPANGRGLGGGVHVWNASGDIVYVITRDAGIVAIAVGATGPIGVTSLECDASRSWFTPALDYLEKRLYVIADNKEMWFIDVSTHEAVLDFRADGFAMDATAGVGGMCLTWDRPEMPWTQSRIYPEQTTPGVSMSQPRFSRLGTSFGFISDTHGVANVTILGDDIVDYNVEIIDVCEHAGPTWGPGQRSWCFNSDGTRVAYTRNEDGFGSLWVFDRSTGSRHRIGQGVHGCLSWEGDVLAAVRTGARTPLEVVVYDVRNISDPARQILVRPSDDRWRSDEVDVELVEPSVEHVLVEDHDIVYRLYRANTPNGAVLCWVHGGPIDQWQVTFRPRLIFWLSRGYSIAVVDHRGTTGHGRYFALALEGHWGEHDVTDTVAVLGDLHQRLNFTPSKTVIMGSSAGGLTALNTVVRDSSLMAGVVVGYPVVDLAEMLNGDDPFESHYMPRLIGASASSEPVLTQRSPHKHPDAFLGTHVLVFHGDQDELVPLSHSELLVEAVQSAGGDIRLIVFSHEGHGFRNAENIRREYTETEGFLSELFR